MTSRFDPSVHPRYSRRALLRAAATLPALLLPACAAPPGGAPTLAPAPAARPSPAAATARYGGVYRILAPPDISSLDPILAYDYIDWWAAAMLLYNRLYGFDAQAALYPDLAADLPTVSADRLRYTIRLREGVRFHSGQPLTAEDVRFSLARALAPDAPAFGASFLTQVVGADEVRAGQSDELRGVRALDPITVEIALKAPQATFLGVLGVFSCAVVSRATVPAAGPAWGVEITDGTGPFRLAEWVRGERLVFTRNPDYFRPGLPYLDRVEIFVNVDQSAGVLRWESQDAEYVYDVPPAQKTELLARPDARVRVGRSLIFDYIQIGRVAPFTDLRVRQAIAHAIDRQDLVRQLGSGVPTESVYPASLAQHDPAFRSRYPYDPELARRLLAEAGYPDGIQDVVLWAGLSSSDDLGLAIQDYLRAIGISTEMLINPYTEAQPLIDSGAIQLWTSGYGYDYPDAAAFITQRLLCPSPAPPAAWCDPQLDDLAARADRLAPDAPERLALLAQIQELVVNREVRLVPLYERESFGLGQTYIHDDPISPLYGLPIPERAWISQSR